MVLDQLSRRAGKVVRYVNLFNVKGTTLEFRKLIRTYITELSGGDAVHSVPPLKSKSFVVSLHTIPIALTYTVTLPHILVALIVAGGRQRNRAKFVQNGQPFGFK